MSKKIKKLSNYSVAGILGVSGLFGLLIVGLVCPLAESASAASTTSFVLNNKQQGESSVSFAMGTENTSATLNGALGNDENKVRTFYRTATINFTASGGYDIYTYANGTGELVGQTDSNNKLTQVSGTKTTATMDDNTWGMWHNTVSGSNTDLTVTTPGSTASYGPVGTSASKVTVGSEGTIGRDNGDFSKKLVLGFAAKINNSTKPDTYKNTVVISVVSKPGWTAAFNNINTMQQLSSSICANANIHDTSYLKDERDNKYYWVTKLEDGHCWMSQNLDLDLYANTADSSVYAGSFDKYIGNTGGTLSKTGQKLTKDNTDISDNVLSTAKMPKSTIQDVAVANANVNTGDMSKNSWDQGLYVKNDPVASDLCNHNNVGIKNCTAQFTDVSGSEWKAAKDPNFINLAKNATYTQDGVTYTKSSEAGMAIDSGNSIYDAHYLIGNYYQYNAATAGSAINNAGENIKDIDAPDSLCPKGWKLPSSNTQEDVSGRGSFYYMLAKYGIATGTNTGRLEGVDQTNKTTNIALNPLFYVRSGFMHVNLLQFYAAGQKNFTWSARTDETNAGRAHHLHVSSDSVDPSNSFVRYYGFSIRCVRF